MRRCGPWVLALSFLLLGAEAKGRIVQQWLDEAYRPREFRKLVVLGISEDIQARKRFENQFVSNLRGRGVQAVTSYSIVPDLTRIEDEQAIVDEVRAQQIEAVITVRLVPLAQRSEQDWVDAWNAETKKELDLREVIDDSLPVAETKAGRFGVEVALWETAEWTRIWGGRTATATRKELRKNSGEFVRATMNVLTNKDLL